MKPVTNVSWFFFSSSRALFQVLFKIHVTFCWNSTLWVFAQVKSRPAQIPQRWALVLYDRWLLHLWHSQPSAALTLHPWWRVCSALTMHRWHITSRYEIFGEAWSARLSFPQVLRLHRFNTPNQLPTDDGDFLEKFTSGCDSAWEFVAKPIKGWGRSSVLPLFMGIREASLVHFLKRKWMNFLTVTVGQPNHSRRSHLVTKECFPLVQHPRLRSTKRRESLVEPFLVCLYDGGQAVSL